jgi:hypothetical protein
MTDSAAGYAVARLLGVLLQRAGVESDAEAELLYTALLRALGELVQPGMDLSTGVRAVAMAVEAVLRAWTRTKARLLIESYLSALSGP